MVANPVLYQNFPRHLRDLYGQVVKASDNHTRHDLLLSLAESGLKYLMSLAFADYRTSALSPSSSVEEEVDRLHKSRPTFGRILRLAKASAAATPNGLFSQDPRFADKNLIAVGHLVHAMCSIRSAVDGMQRTAHVSDIDVGVHVRRGLGAGSDQFSWWDAWPHLIQYRNNVVHHEEHRWPVHSDSYYLTMTSLLEDALVEMLTYQPVADVILDHPVASLTLSTDICDGRTIYTLCGESYGVWQDITIEATDLPTWMPTRSDPKATPPSAFILERVNNTDQFALRAPYWDFHESPPPPLEVDVAAGRSNRTRPPKGLDAVVEGRGTAYGTCGEFAQGPLPDGSNYHVTCPINKSSSVVIEARRHTKYKVVGLQPRVHDKLSLALRYVCDHIEVGPFELEVRHWTDLDVAKGMGSSTADVLAGIRAVANAFKVQLTPEIEGSLAARVESSDGTMYPGIAAVDHKTGIAVRQWSWYPEFVIVMLVPEDNVNTDAIDFRGKEALAGTYLELLEAFDSAIADRSIETFAGISTRAAALNAPYLVNPYAQALKDIYPAYGALGLNIGHTGSVCGLLYPNTQQGQVRASEACREVRRDFAELRDVKVVTTPYCPLA